MSNSNITIIKDLNCKIIKAPDNDKDRKLFNKKGFTNSSLKKRYGEYFFTDVPDKFYCSYENKIVKNGGIMGFCDSSFKSWTIYNKKTKNPVVSISEYRDGDYPPSDKIKWY
jgi:hypothetical protein